MPRTPPEVRDAERRASTLNAGDCPRAVTMIASSSSPASLAPNQLIALLQVHGDKAVTAYVGEVLERRLLDLAQLRGHHHVVVFHRRRARGRRR